LDNNQLWLGEVGLGGELRRVGQLERRIKEAEKLGYIHSWAKDQHHSNNKPSHLKDILNSFGQKKSPR